MTPVEAPDARVLALQEAADLVREQQQYEGIRAQRVLEMAARAIERRAGVR